MIQQNNIKLLHFCNNKNKLDVLVLENLQTQIHYFRHIHMIVKHKIRHFEINLLKSLPDVSEKVI